MFIFDSSVKLIAGDQMKMSQAITWNKYDPIDWRVYVSPGLNKSIECIMKLWPILWLFISLLKSMWVSFVP